MISEKVVDTQVPAEKLNKRARRGARGAHLSPKKGMAGKKAAPLKKASKGAKNAEAARDGSKTAKVLDMLKRNGGATAKELLKVTGWRAHSLRGFISGTLNKKMGLTIISAKGEDGERNYSVKA